MKSIESKKELVTTRTMAQGDGIFRDLSADDTNQETTVIESCCMNCYENVGLNNNNLMSNWKCQTLYKN